MKITVAQRRALLYLVHRKPGEWVRGTPVNQRCLNTLSKKGLVDVCFDGRVWLERITDAGREAVEHLRALDRWKCDECGDINDNSMKVCECGAANSSGK